MNNKISSRSKIYFAIFVLILFLAAMACGGSAASPSGAGAAPTLSLATPTQFAAFIPAEATQVSQPEIPETRRLTLEYPKKMRAGVEGDVVRLTLEVDNLGNVTPTAEIQGNIVTGQTVQIPNLYETHNVTAEARLDLAGVLVQPSDAIFEPLTPGQSVTFYWSIRPADTGTYRGTVWLHLNFKDKTTGEESRIPLSAQVIEIEAVDFFGLSVNLARTSGVIGSVLGGVIGFPFLEEILKFLFKKRKK